MTDPQSAPDKAAQLIADGRAVMGCELGSTRIKSTLVTPDGRPVRLPTWLRELAHA